MSTQYLKHQSRDGYDWVVKQSKDTLYYDEGDQALYAIKELQFVGWEWVLIYSHVNDSNDPVTYEEEVTMQHTFKSGASNDLDWKLGVEFHGVSVSGGGANHTFTEEEISKGTKQTHTFHVPAKSALYVYQKRYNFKSVVWFILDAWGQHIRVGHKDDYERIEVVAESFVDANELASTTEEITGDTTFVPDAWDGERADFDVTRRFYGCTGRCSEYLEEHGIHG